MRGRRARGFTLIEVVIAFAILGLSLAVLYGAFANAMSRLRRDARVSEATLISKSLLARAGVEFSPTQGTVIGDWNDYRYELTQATVNPAPGQVPFTRPTVLMTAKVMWDGSGGPQGVQLSTLELLPRGDR